MRWSDRLKRLEAEVDLPGLASLSMTDLAAIDAEVGALFKEVGKTFYRKLPHEAWVYCHENPGKWGLAMVAMIQLDEEFAQLWQRLRDRCEVVRNSPAAVAWLRQRKAGRRGR
jgi:hypothetical protein